MADFDFSTLNSSDFEDFVRDLLNAEARDAGSDIVFRTFKDGRDKGIDLLFSTTDNDYEIIGQVKHYYRSGVTLLLSHLRNTEAVKVRKLKPTKYIVATSVELSANNVQEIKSIFAPYILKLSDVYDKILLNSLLDRFPQVLQTHYKLWFSNTQVLRTILHYDVQGRSNEFEESELKKRLRLYVETPSLQEARSILKKNNFVIIVGEPGVGKTTTAELLVYEMIKDGYELIYIYDDIKEAEVFLNDPDKKVIFYFDDFLGHNSVEIEKARGSETALLKALRRVSTSANKKFVFTTRTFILNHAVESSERLRQFNVKAKQSLIPLAVYNDDLKRRMLNNHIEESKLSEPHKQVLTSPSIQDFIVRHPTFSPRSVSFITSSSTLLDVNPDVFEKYIRENFNRPDEIWRHAYEEQIDDLARLLLNTMVSFGSMVDIAMLEIAFNKRLDYEVKQNNFQKPLHPFRSAFRRLENGFIVADSHQPEIFLFINPSLIDFLIASIRSDKSESTRIVEAAAYVSQLTTRLYTLDNIRQDVALSHTLKNRIINSYSEFIHEDTSDLDLIDLSLLVYYYLENKPLVIEILEKVEEWDYVLESRNSSVLFWNFLQDVRDLTLIEFVARKAFDIFIPMLLLAKDIFDFESAMELAFSKFSFRPESNSTSLDDLNATASSLLNEKIEADIEELKEYTNAQDFVNEKEEASELLKDELERYGLTLSADFAEYNAYDWWEIGTQNYFAEQMAKDD